MLHKVIYHETEKDGRAERAERWQRGRGDDDRVGVIPHLIKRNIEWY